MIKNAVKKLATFCLLAVLCVPCCLASAQVPEYPQYELSLADQDSHIRDAVEAEAERCAEKHNFTFPCSLTAMNGEELMKIYNSLLALGIARPLEILMKL